MSRDLVTISARVDADSDLASELEEYQEQNSMTSKSEAVRHLLRSGLAQEMERPDDVVDDDRDAARDADSSPSIDLNLIQGNEAIILGFAFLIGSNDILAALTAIAGRLGGWLFIAIGLLLSAWLLWDFAAGLDIEIERLGRQTGAE
jgi:hypothetical protein